MQTQTSSNSASLSLAAPGPRSPRNKSITRGPPEAPAAEQLFTIFPEGGGNGAVASRTPATQPRHGVLNMPPHRRQQQPSKEQDFGSDDTFVQELGGGGMTSNGHRPKHPPPSASPTPPDGPENAATDMEMLAVPPLYSDPNVSTSQAVSRKRKGAHTSISIDGSSTSSGGWQGGRSGGFASRLSRCFPSPFRRALRRIGQIATTTHQYLLLLPVVFLCIFVVGVVFCGIDVAKTTRHYRATQHSEDAIVATKLMVRILQETTGFLLRGGYLSLTSLDAGEYAVLRGIFNQETSRMHLRGKGLPSITFPGNGTEFTRSGEELLKEAVFYLTAAGGFDLSTAMTRLFMYATLTMKYCASEGDIYFGGIDAAAATTLSRRMAKGAHRTQYVGLALQARLAAAAEVSQDLMHIDEVDGGVGDGDLTGVRPSIYRPLPVPTLPTAPTRLGPRAKAPFANPASSLYRQFPTVGAFRVFQAHAHAIECWGSTYFLQRMFVVGTGDAADPRNNRILVCDSGAAALRNYLMSVMPLRVPTVSSPVNATNTTTNATYKYTPYTSAPHPLFLKAQDADSVVKHVARIFDAYTSAMDVFIAEVQSNRRDWLGPVVIVIVYQVLALLGALVGAVVCALMVRQHHQQRGERAAMKGDFECTSTAVRIAPETERLVDVVSTYLGALNVQAATFGSPRSKRGEQDNVNLTLPTTLCEDGQIVRNLRRAAYPLFMLRPFVPSYMFVASLRMAPSDNSEGRDSGGNSGIHNFLCSISAVKYINDRSLSTSPSEQGTNGTRSAFELLNLTPSITSVRNVVHMVIDLERINRDIEQFFAFGVEGCTARAVNQSHLPSAGQSSSPAHLVSPSQNTDNSANANEGNLLAAPPGAAPDAIGKRPDVSWMEMHDPVSYPGDCGNMIQMHRPGVVNKAAPTPPSTPTPQRAPTPSTTNRRKRAVLPGTVRSKTARPKSAPPTIEPKEETTLPTAAEIQRTFPFSDEAAMDRLTVALSSLLSVVHRVCHDFGGQVIQVAPQAIVCEFSEEGGLYSLSAADGHTTANTNSTANAQEDNLERNACLAARMIHHVCAAEMSGVVAQVSGCPPGTFLPNLFPHIALVNGPSLRGSSRFHVSRHFTCLSSSLAISQRLLKVAAFHGSNIVMTVEVAKRLKGMFGVRAIHTFLLWDRVVAEQNAAATQFTREAPVEGSVSAAMSGKRLEGPSSPLLGTTIRLPRRRKTGDRSGSISTWLAESVNSTKPPEEVFGTTAPPAPTVDPYKWLTPVGFVSCSTAVAQRCVTACELVFEIPLGGMSADDKYLHDKKKLSTWNQVWELYELLLLDEKPTTAQMEGVYRALERYRTEFVSPPSSSTPAASTVDLNSFEMQRVSTALPHASQAAPIPDSVLRVAMATVRGMMGQEGYTVGSADDVGP